MSFIQLTLVTFCVVGPKTFSKREPKNSSFDIPRMDQTDVLTWLTTEEEAMEFLTGKVMLVGAVLYMSEPLSQRFLLKWRLTAIILRETHPQIRMCALDAEKFPDVEGCLMPKNIPYPFVVKSYNVEDLFINCRDGANDYVDEILKAYPGDDDKLAQYFFEDPKDLMAVQLTLLVLSNTFQPDRLKYETVNIREDSRCHYLDENPRKAPYFVIDEKHGSTYGIYNPSGPSIARFVDNYYAGRLKPSFKSEPRPTQDTAPVKLVAYTHAEALSDTSKTYLINYYKGEGKLGEGLAKLFASEPNVVIANLDLKLNTVDVGEGNYLYPAGALDDSGDRIVIKCPYLSLLDSLEAFVRNKGDLTLLLPQVDASDLRKYLTTHDKVVVEYYHEERDMCVFFAAEDLRETHPDVRFVGVRVSKGEEDFQIYYKGETVETVFGFNIKKKITHAFHPIYDIYCESMLKALLKDRQVKPLVVQFGAQEHPELLEVVLENGNKYWFAKADEKLKPSISEMYNTSLGGEVTWILIYPDLLSDVRLYIGDMDKESFAKFLDKSTPLVERKISGVVDPKPKKAQVIYFYTPYHELDIAQEGLEASARNHPEFSFAYADIRSLADFYEFGHVKYLSHLCKSLLVIVDPTPYILDIPKVSRGTSKTIIEFVEAYHDGKLKPFEQPKEWSITRGENPVEFNSLNHDPLIDDESKKIVIWYHEGRIYHLLSQLGAHFAFDDNIVVGHMNTKHLLYLPYPSISEYSWLVMYPAYGETQNGTRRRKPVIYDGPNNLQSLVQFVDTGSHIFELTAESYPKFVQTTKLAIIRLYHSSRPDYFEDILFFKAMKALNSTIICARIDLDLEPAKEDFIRSVLPEPFSPNPAFRNIRRISE